jgi:osmotically-inducible protein OsmY
MEEPKRDPSIKATRIGVKVDNGAVTLSGYVENYAQKWGAERAAQKVCGVKALAVEIEVVQQGLNNRSDADIARTAKNVLEWTINWLKVCVKVIVENGWVSLSGELDYEYQRQLATASVRHLIGVTGVTNQTAVKPSLTSRVIKSVIQAALKRRALIVAEKIKTTVNGGNGNLSGVMQSWSEGDMVSDSAWSTLGVTHVTDNISDIY